MAWTRRALPSSARQGQVSGRGWQNELSQVQSPRHRSEHWKRRNFGQRPLHSGSSAFRIRLKYRCAKCISSSRCRIGRLLCREWRSSDCSRAKFRCAHFFWPDIPSAHFALTRGSVPPYFLQFAIASFVAASSLERECDHPTIRRFFSCEASFAMVALLSTTNPVRDQIVPSFFLSWWRLRLCWRADFFPRSVFEQCENVTVCGKH
jgi:hypothetical protein